METKEQFKERIKNNHNIIDGLMKKYHLKYSEAYLLYLDCLTEQEEEE